jgi:hypothetical protein
LGDRVGITRVSTMVNGVQQAGAQRWTIDGAVGELPQQVFRQVLYLRLVLDGKADGLTFLSEQTRLRGKFSSYSYDAKATANPALVVEISQVGDAVLVELAAPRQLAAVQLVNSFAPGSSSKVTVHRVDGEKVVEEPTVEAGWDHRFDRVAIEVGNFDFRGNAQSRAAAPSGGAVSVITQAQQALRLTNVATLPTDFTDARFGLRLRDGSTPLQSNHLSGLTVRSYPSAPRIGLAMPSGLADPTALTAPIFFTRLDGEIGKEGDANAGQINSDTALAKALQQQVDTFFAQLVAETPVGETPLLPTDLTVALVLESDAPCQLLLDEFVVAYQLVRRTFPARAEKVVLRFAGTTAETQSVKLSLSKQATVTQATLTVAANLDAAKVANGMPGNGFLPDTLAQATAIHLGLERWAAQPFTPAQAITARGLAVGLLALTADAQLALELYEDWQGQPAGKKLFATTLTVGQSGQRLWKTATLDEDLLLATQPYWLLLKAVRGAALWLAQPGESSVQMLIQANNRWQPLSMLPNTQGLLHLLSLVAPKEQNVPFTLTIGPTTVAPNPKPDPNPNPDDGRETFDLTLALNTALAAPPTSGLVDIPLSFTTTLAGIVTVYPPVVEYSVGQ